LNQEKETGVSVIEISKNQFDAGKILLRKVIPINEHTRFDQL
jgi:methionyl-tRNA formyltransferase